VSVQILRLELLLLDDERIRLELDGRLSRRQALELGSVVALLRHALPSDVESAIAGERVAAFPERHLRPRPRPGQRSGVPGRYRLMARRLRHRHSTG
jgi:hypothetical protein